MHLSKARARYNIRNIGPHITKRRLYNIQPQRQSQPRVPLPPWSQPARVCHLLWLSAKLVRQAHLTQIPIPKTYRREMGLVLSKQPWGRQNPPQGKGSSYLHPPFGTTLITYQCELLPTILRVDDRAPEYDRVACIQNSCFRWPVGNFWHLRLKWLIFHK